MDLKTDPKRVGRFQDHTGILVRAKGPQGFDNFDIAELSRESLLEWLRVHHYGNARFCENIVLGLLGHKMDENKEG